MSTAMINGHHPKPAASRVETVPFPEFEKWVKEAGTARVQYLPSAADLPKDVRGPWIFDGLNMYAPGTQSSPVVYETSERAVAEVRKQVMAYVAPATVVYLLRLPNVFPFRGGFACLTRLTIGK